MASNNNNEGAKFRLKFKLPVGKVMNSGNSEERLYVPAIRGGRNKAPLPPTEGNMTLGVVKQKKAENQQKRSNEML